MRTAQPTRPAVRARMFWPRQPASRVSQAPANAAGRLPYLPLGCACLFLLGYLPGIWLGRTGAWVSGSQLAATCLKAATARFSLYGSGSFPLPFCSWPRCICAAFRPWDVSFSQFYFFCAVAFSAYALPAYWLQGRAGALSATGC